jgi:hypothetical protein
MLEAGTSVVAGVTPGRGGQRVLGRIPVYDSVAEAVIDPGGVARDYRDNPWLRLLRQERDDGKASGG